MKKRKILMYSILVSLAVVAFDVVRLYLKKDDKVQDEEVT